MTSDTAFAVALAQVAIVKHRTTNRGNFLQKFLRNVVEIKVLPTSAGDRYTCSANLQ